MTGSPFVLGVTYVAAFSMKIVEISKKVPVEDKYTYICLTIYKKKAPKNKPTFDHKMNTE